MNERQEETLAYIQHAAFHLLDKKFRAGDKEHGGKGLHSFTPEKLLNHAIEEALDELIYLLALKRKMREGLAAAKGDLE